MKNFPAHCLGQYDSNTKTNDITGKESHMQISLMNINAKTLNETLAKQIQPPYTKGI